MVLSTRLSHAKHAFQAEFLQFPTISIQPLTSSHLCAGNLHRQQTKDKQPGVAGIDHDVAALGSHSGKPSRGIPSPGTFKGNANLILRQE